jgi:hypothetical protein
MKHHNPHTPIMVREALNTQPRVFARYEFGREKVEELGGEFTTFLLSVGGEHGAALEAWKRNCKFRQRLRGERKGRVRVRVGVGAYATWERQEDTYG